jgi:hypothetical protein
MMLPSAGISAMSSFQSAAPSNPCSVSSSLFGSKGTVSHTVAFDTTACLARTIRPPMDCWGDWSAIGYYLGGNRVFEYGGGDC